MKEPKQLTKDEIQSIVDTMCFYKRTEGYIAFIGEKITFFDSKPSMDSAYVTLKQLLRANEPATS